MVNVAVVELVSPHSSVAVNVTVIVSVHPVEVHAPGCASNSSRTADISSSSSGVIGQPS